MKGTLFDNNAQPEVYHITPSNYLLFPNLRTVYPMYEQFIVKDMAIKAHSSASLTTSSGQYIVAQYAPSDSAALQANLGNPLALSLLNMAATAIVPVVQSKVI